MTFQETKQWLKRAWWIDTEINQMLRMYYEELMRETSITAQLTGMPGTPSKDPHKIEKLIIYESKINEKIEELKRAKREIQNAIKGLNDPVQRTVLTNYYITDKEGKHKTFEQIAEKMNYSERQVQRIHNAAVDEIAKRI